MGPKKIILESDSKYLVDNILRADPNSMKNQPLIKKIRSFAQQEWQMEVVHTYWEGNQRADWLANNSLNLDLGFHILITSPHLNRLKTGDAFGVSTPRIISM